MKIGIITFHFPYNCGAVLQCVALQKKMQQLGHDVKVVNYRPCYHQNRYTPFKNPIYYAGKCMQRKYEVDPIIKRLARGVLGALRTVYSWRFYKKIKISESKFENFIKTYLNETKVIRTNKELEKKYPNCGLFISGSDQLWNAGLTEGKIDPAYLLDFVSNGAGRISYAVGADFTRLLQDKVEVKEALLQFDSISLREKACYDTIHEMCGDRVPMHVDIDPTFLLNEEEYEEFCCEQELEEEPYILTYVMPNISQMKVYNAAKILSEKTGYKVIDVNGSPSRGNTKIKDYRVCGPAEFLWYVKHAEYVLTNSFHGTAFSVTFHKQFMAIPHSDTGYRVTELLDRLSLSERYVSDGESAVATIDKTIEFELADQLLGELREESVGYLKQCVEKYGKD